MNNDHFFQVPSLLETEEIMCNSYARLKRDLLLTPGQHRYFYYTLELRARAVLIIGITPTGDYVLIQEYRHPTGRIILGCAGGLVDEDEDILDAARRELLEETGYDAETFELLGKGYGYPGVTGQEVSFVCAHNARKVQEPMLELSEFIVPLVLTLEELHKKMNQGPVDSLLCSALFFHNLKKL